MLQAFPYIQANLILLKIKFKYLFFYVIYDVDFSQYGALVVSMADQDEKGDENKTTTDAKDAASEAAAKTEGKG